MKKKIMLIGLLMSVLTSCNFLGFEINFGESKDIETGDVSLNEGRDSTAVKPNPETSGNKPTPSSSAGSGSSVDKAELITIFSINDLHGSLEENTSSKELGLAKLDYAIKHDIDYDPNTSIIISCGDSWQGGYLAHEEKSITDELLGEMGVECMVVGNHEFDWGIDTIKDLKKVSPFPFLACNIKNPNGRTTYDLSDPSIVIEKRGVKVGIIGAIGAGEASSISTSALANYGFSSSTDLINTEITKLNQQGCDLVVMAVHDSAESDGSGYVNSIANTFDSTKIQGIFGAHTHQFENLNVGTNKIPFVQAGCNSKGYAKMSFSVKQKKVIEKSYNNAYNSYHSIETSKLNQTIVNKLTEASSKYKSKEVIATFQGEFRRYYELNKFIPETMLSEAKRYGWKKNNPMIGLHNLSGIRSNIPSGQATRDILFKCEPFDNKVLVIQNVPGSSLSKLIGEVKDNHQSTYYAYTTEDDSSFDSSLTYDVVTIDFVSEGNYWTRNIGAASKFPQHNIDKSTDQKRYILDVMIDYIIHSPSKTFKASDYA